MDFVSWGKIPRFNKPWEITEKIDGTNGVLYWTDVMDGRMDDRTRLARVDGMHLYAGSRNRWLTPHSDNFGFAKWAMDNAGSLRQLGPGRHFGEWYGKGIQRGYGLPEKRFALFDTTKLFDVEERYGPMPDVGSVLVLMGAADGVELNSTINGCLEDLRKCGSAQVPGFMKPEGIVVRHTQSGSRFKVLLENDDVAKSRVFADVGA